MRGQDHRVLRWIWNRQALDADRSGDGGFEDFVVRRRPNSFRPLHMLVDFDAKGESRPFQRMKVIVGPPDVVVPFRRPLAILEAEARCEESRLSLLGIAWEKVEVAEAPRPV